MIWTIRTVRNAGLARAFLMGAVMVTGLMSGVTVSAQSATEDPSSSTAKLPVTSPTRQDPDAEITNARLRAATGSKSLVSLQSSFNYNGGSINSPLSRERPVLSPGTIEIDPAKLTGSISGKYRATDYDNINVGIGVGWLTPTYDGQRGQIENPYLAYGRVFKAGNVQNALNVQLTKYTAASAVDISRLNFETDIDHTFLVPIGDGAVQLGLVLAWYREFYSQNTNGVQDTLAAFPFAEYEINPTFSLRTVYRGFTYFNTVSETANYVHDDPTQSAGLGIAIARDFYLYPNVQWVWGDMRAEKTNVALSANINL